MAGAGRGGLHSVQVQARLQVASQDGGYICYELLEPERDAAAALVANRGLLGLPEPAAGDLFFDIEGARYFVSEGTGGEKHANSRSTKWPSHDR